MEQRIRVQHNILVINDFVMLMVGDSWCGLREVLIWKDVLDAINIVLDSPSISPPGQVPAFSGIPARKLIEATLHNEQHQ